MKNILVTGGAGYIGSHCVLELVKKNYNVIVFDNLSTGHIETINTLKQFAGIKFVNGDLLNKEDLENVFCKNKIDAVIHFAAFSLVGESVKNPQKYYINNVCGTINLMQSMLRYDVKKLVFSSTAATYGEPQYTPIDEKHPQKPINTYGMTKLMLERIMDDYDRAYGFRSVRLRYFNVAGANSEALVGEWHDTETHLIPNILKSTFKSETNFKLFGNDYNTKDGTCVRDYINVEDLAKAHILALEYLNKNGKTDYFNLGTNNGNSNLEIFKTCEKITDRNIPFEICPRREGDPAILVADNTKAKNILGWSPEKDIEYSIKTAYNWEKKLSKRSFIR